MIQANLFVRQQTLEGPSEDKFTRCCVRIYNSNKNILDVTVQPSHYFSHVVPAIVEKRTK